MSCSMDSSRTYPCMSAYNFGLWPPRASCLVRHLNTVATHTSTQWSQTIGLFTSAVSSWNLALNSQNSSTSQVATSFQNISRCSSTHLYCRSIISACVTTQMQFHSLLARSLSALPYLHMGSINTFHTYQRPYFFIAMITELSELVLFWITAPFYSSHCFGSIERHTLHSERCTSCSFFPCTARVWETLFQTTS